eukprot:CAMPEP_0113531614 /NCGR_PEP_ID=MMETSP0015_2-20120614/3594_1 /TAXON_ID=2838 /ORGANISM="Odontella" /LENGTH=304 /DNA_ID=CAMNT_0000430469 /DNA_START=497 /DNA_END=1411 /DNA_ORIENTATION=+ /assembly_acc=CAM_ASM_000160
MSDVGVCSVHDCSTDGPSWPSSLKRSVSTERTPLLLRCACADAKVEHETASSDVTNDIADTVLARFAATLTQSSQTGGPGCLPVRAFFSESGYFHLDGKWEMNDGSAHPDGVLTACASADMPLREFLGDMSGWKSRYMVESIRDNDSGPEDAIRSILDHYTLGDEWRSALSSWGEEKLPVMHQLFISLGETRTQLHRDHFDNLFLCLSGTRHWRISNPGNSSRVQLEEGSISSGLKLPRLRNVFGPTGRDCITSAYYNVPFVEVTVSAGDALFVPSGWWHDVTANVCGNPSSVAVNWYFDPPRK